MNDEITVGELRGLLEEQPEDAIVRVVHQPAWPLQEVLGGIAWGPDILGREPEDEPPEDDDVMPVLYLVANGHPARDTPYGPRGAWDAMRRGW